MKERKTMNLNGINGIFGKLIYVLSEHAPVLSAMIGSVLATLLAAGWLLGQIESREARHAEAWQVVVDRILEVQRQTSSIIAENSRIIGDNSRILQQVANRLEAMERK